MWRDLLMIDQRWVSMDKIAPALKNSVIAAEDANFYEHHGVDFRAMKEAWERNQKRKKYARGFSTIPMQLAKNIYLFPMKTVFRKGIEIALAFEMEIFVPKERILELYLNLIEWGPKIYGAEAASHYYFKKPAADLSAGEAAFLAAIIPNPKKWGRWPPGPYVRRRMSLLQGVVEP